MEYKFKCKNCDEEIVTRHLNLGEPAKCKKCGEFTKVEGVGVETVNDNIISEEMANYEKRSKSGAFVNFMAYAGIFSVLIGLPILASFGEGLEDIIGKLIVCGILALIHLLGLIVFSLIFLIELSKKKSLLLKLGVFYYWIFPLIIFFIFTFAETYESKLLEIDTMIVHPESRSLIFISKNNSNYKAMLVKDVNETFLKSITSYITSHKETITKIVTYAELLDLKYLTDSQDPHKSYSYHISISIDRPLMPSEHLQGFSLDGRYDSISFISDKDADAILKKGESIKVANVPHELHYSTKKIIHL